MSADFRVPAWLCAVILSQLRAEVADRPAAAPHGFTIGGEENPYLRRWFITPRGDGPAVYLHQFLRDDDDRAFHDHPWASIGLILTGGYREHTPDGVFIRAVGDVVVRAPESLHRVELFRDGRGAPIEAWTMFLVGARVREWGFACPQGWVHWRDFTAGENGERVGAGCAAMSSDA